MSRSKYTIIGIGIAFVFLEKIAIHIGYTGDPSSLQGVRIQKARPTSVSEPVATESATISLSDQEGGTTTKPATN